MQAVFIPGSAPGAIPNGTRIQKVWSDPGDANPVGTTGRVKSSFVIPEEARESLSLKERFGEPIERFGYFVEWDAMPGVPIFCRAKKIGLATELLDEDSIH